MIANATEAQKQDDEIELRVLGGDLEDEGTSEHVLADRKCVMKILRESFSLPVKEAWGSVDFVEVIFEGSKWLVR